LPSSKGWIVTNHRCAIAAFKSGSCCSLLSNHFRNFPSPLLKTAACIELTCGLLISIGLMTELVAILASGEMAFAYFLGHFPIAFWPIASKGVPAVLFCFAFLFIATHGAGIWSLDSLWRRPVPDK
jgi:uncharacterized membrane protein YphA (DoxX/SURF4 family)